MEYYDLSKEVRDQLLSNLNSTTSNEQSNLWSPLVAKEVLTAWQRQFTASIYNHKLNFHKDGTEERIIHPLASTSISDMLAEFCDFNYLIIFVGYFVMVSAIIFKSYVLKN